MQPTCVDGTRASGDRASAISAHPGGLRAISARWAYRPASEGSAGTFAVGGFGSKEMHVGGWLEEDGDDDDYYAVSSKAVHPRKRFGFFRRLFKKEPKPRLAPSAADASSLCGQEVATEEDILHVKSLPDFNGTLRAADSELLLQYLTAPYLRVPLLLRFFSQASHTAALAHPELQDVLDAAVFEPGLWQPNEKKEMPQHIPAESTRHLATPVGLLF